MTKHVTHIGTCFEAFWLELFCLNFKMWLFVLLSIVAIILLAIFGLLTYARWNFGSLEKQGITVVEPNHFLLGGAMLSFEKNGGLLDIENMKKYGPVFGLYEGREPQIFICDAELIRLITTKDAEYFDSKRFIDFGDPLFNEMLDFQPLEKWKTLRGMFSPIFNSTSRLKKSNAPMRESVSDFIDNIQQKIKTDGKQGKLENYSLSDGIHAMSTDLLARAQYGISIGKSEEENPFVQIIKKLMAPPAVEAPWIATYSYAFPFIKSLLPNTLINPEPVKEFIEILRKMMDIRRKQNKESGNSTAQRHEKDLLDHIIEWYDDLPNNPEYKKNGINEMSIFNMGLILFTATQDQLSLIISTLFYYVSKNPEIESRLHDEVDKIWKQYNGMLEHEALAEMPFLNACVHEATRLYPFFFRGERVCTKDWENDEWGIKIKKGDMVQIAIWAAHRNPKYFDDPEEFMPSRFMPGNKEKMHPYAYAAYGFGPRNCLGKRFAVEMMMLISAHLIRRLRFLKRKDTKIEFLPVGPFFAAHEPIVFDVETRH